MAKGRYTARDGVMDWKLFQEHMDYSDEEIAALLADELKVQYVTTGASPEWNDRWIVVEVVESHGCESGMQVGDRLYFKGTGCVLDPTRSSPWCVHCLHSLGWYVRGFRALYMNGGDPTQMYVLYGGCPDNTQFGLGRVIYELKFVEDKDIDNI